MNNKIYKRVLEEANLIIDTKKTIRDISKIMKVSKSTVHKDLHERLFLINENLYDRVNEILKYHIKIICDIQQYNGMNFKRYCFSF